MSIRRGNEAVAYHGSLAAHPWPFAPFVFRRRLGGIGDPWLDLGWQVKVARQRCRE